MHIVVQSILPQQRTSVSYSAASDATSGKDPVNSMPIQLDVQMLSAVETRLRIVNPYADISKVELFDTNEGRMPKKTGITNVVSRPAHASQ